MKPVLWILLLLTGSICIGWRRNARRAAFAYTHLDAEMDALRRCIPPQTTPQNHLVADSGSNVTPN